MSDKKIITTHDEVPFYKDSTRKRVKKNPVEDLTEKAITTRNVVPYGKAQKRIKDKDDV